MIYKTIKNSKYIGETLHRDTVYKNIYPAIIDMETWNRVQEIRDLNKKLPGKKKEVYEFLLSGKLICGDCKNLMVGESGTSKCGNTYYYYNCLTKRRKKEKCNFKAVNKETLEDFVITTTCKLLYNEKTIKELSSKILKTHQTLTKQDTILKSLKAKKDSLLKSSNNLITAIEQGFITEQTKLRLKELEAEILKVEFDIQQEENRVYSFLTQEKIENYLKGIISGDINNYHIRKKIVMTFIKEIILYNDKIVITYNFVEKFPQKLIDCEYFKEKEQSEIETALNNFKCSYIRACSPPIENNTNSHCEFVLFFCLDYFGLITEYKK